MCEDRINNIEYARMATLSGDYDIALDILELLIQKSPNNIDALLLKGNALELQLASEFYPIDHHNPLLNVVRCCYEKVLSLDPNNSFALKDFADYYGSIGETEKAFSLYEKLINLLNHRKLLGEDVDNELEAANTECAELRRA